MKKLMIMAMVASAAVAAQATAYFAVKSDSPEGQEDAGTLYNGKGKGTVLGNHSVYLLVMSSPKYDDWEALAGQVLSAFRAGTLSESNIGNYGSYVATLTTESNGRIDTAQGFSYADGTSNTRYGFLAVAFYDSNIYFGDATFSVIGRSTASQAQVSSRVGLIDFWFSDATPPSQENVVDSAGWYSSVPEPTSGLLMLLGFAGLALKRKRA